MYLWILALCAASNLVGKENVEIPINIGVGPSFLWLPGLTPNQEIHNGVRLDLYGVIDNATIKKHKNRIPKQYRKLATSQQEIHISPLLLRLIPNVVIISPHESGSVYGANWTLLGAGLNWISTDFLVASTNLNLPTLTYVYAESSANNPDGNHLFGIGASPSIETQWRINRNWLLGLAYYHTFQLPLAMNSYLREDGSSKQWNHYGEISILLNYRFPITKKM